MDLVFDILQAIGLATAAGVLSALIVNRTAAGALSLLAGTGLGAWSALGDDGLWFLALVFGGAAAVLASGAADALFTGVRARLGDAGSAGLVAYAVFGALVVAGASLLFAPLGAVAFVLLLWFGLAARRRASEKYAGLRILSE